MYPKHSLLMLCTSLEHSLLFDHFSCTYQFDNLILWPYMLFPSLEISLTLHD